MKKKLVFHRFSFSKHYHVKVAPHEGKETNVKKRKYDL